MGSASPDDYYSLLTLICAVALPVMCALAVFAGLRKSPLSLRFVSYFLCMPIYVAAVVFLFTDIIHIELFGIAISGYKGFVSSIALGILYIGLCALIAGGGVMRKPSVVVCVISTIIFSLSSAATVYFAAGFKAPEVEGFFCPTIGEVFGLNALPEIISDIQIDMANIILLLIYLIILFLCFFGTETPVERRMRMSRRAVNSASGEGSDNFEPELTPCCSVCEYARLMDNSTDVVCTKKGVTDGGHCCRDFMYDPLKRVAGRPKLPSDEE